MRSGREPQVFLRELSAHCRALLTVRAVPRDADAILDVTKEEEARCRAQAEGFSQARLMRMLDLFMRAEGELRFASTPRIALESAALHACEPPMEESAAALLERIAELEARLKRLEAAPPAPYPRRRLRLPPRPLPPRPLPPRLLPPRPRPPPKRPRRRRMRKPSGTKRCRIWPKTSRRCTDF